MAGTKAALGCGDVEVDVETAPFLIESVRQLQRPRKRMSGEHYRKLKHYALYSVLMLLSIVMQANYLASKCYLYYLHPGEVVRKPWLIVLMLCECVYLATSVLTSSDHLMPPSSRPDLGLLDVTTRSSPPTVDIFIPTCKEPTDVPVEAVKAALAIDYPADRMNVFVLDDGGDDALRCFCEGERVVYIRREKRKGVPHNFKCGNMNNGLKFSDAEYVVMMDADMILHPSYLRRLLPHIVNTPDVSFVQIPQAFYNLPVGDPLNDSCIMGYQRVLANRDSVGTATCVGTGALFRRRHLDEIDGFQPQSITEDTMTAYMLFNRGYESVYLSENLQVGLTPWTFQGYVKQRTRWGKGAIQQWAASWRTCLGKHSQLNLLQKIYYFYHTGYYFVAFVNVGLVGTLLGAVAFNWKLSVGSELQNAELVKALTYYLVSMRVASLALWVGVPQAILMRNREESHFWWMTPYYVEMVVESLRDFKSTFVFVPTSNIDKAAAAAAGPRKAGLAPAWITRHYNKIDQVKWHITFIIIAMTVVISRCYHAIYITRDCNEAYLAVGVSLFIVSVSAHMMIPVMFVFFPPNIKPSERKSLLHFNKKGVPEFTLQDCIPKWSWGVVPYEILSWINLIFWAAVMVVLLVHPSTDILHSWCKAS